MKFRGYILFLTIVIGGTVGWDYYSDYKQAEMERINSSLPENVNYNGDRYHATYPVASKD